ncbi:MAG: transglycosylase SLT domain-containing protein [Blastocatellia bacterium]|nr:transglycosylase SLT domain-containing protein [Blastocatellia bacterium]
MLRSSIAAIIFSFIALASDTNAQSLQERADLIRAAMDGRDFDRVERLVRDLRASDQVAFTRNNYDYLLGRLAERRGARAEAASLYLAVLGRDSNLAQYALWHLSMIARASDDLALERQYITRLLARYPSSALIARARDRMIDSLFESGQYRAAVPLLRPLASVRGQRGRDALARLGEAYSKSGDAAAARAVFEQLIAGSRDDHALAAAAGLDSLDAASRTKPDEFEALRRARIYLHNRHWREARDHLLYIVERFPDSPNRPEALYQTGFTYYREENHDEAIKWFNRAHAEFSAKTEGEQGYYWVATSLQKARRYGDAARRYSDFIEAYPNSDLVESAYRNTVDSLRYGRKDAEAIEWSRKMGRVFAGKPLAVVALFNEARIELTRGNYQAAHTLLLRLEAQGAYRRIFSAPIRGEAAFLRIFAIEKMGRLSEAAQAYLAIPDERDNYFGYRATLRLRAIARTPEGRRIIEPIARRYANQARAALQSSRYSEAKTAATRALRLIEDETARREMVAILRTSYGRLPAYASVSRFRLIPAARDAIRDGQSPAVAKGITLSSHRSLGRELAFLGLYDEGATEMRLGGIGGRAADDGVDKAEPGEEDIEEVIVSTAAMSTDTAYSLAVYSLRGDQAQYAIRFAEPLFRSVPQDYRIELVPRDLAEMMYPAPYRDALNRYATPRDVDPRLVLSLARQESRFNPSVKSPASARGLMQFIAETAEKMASAEGIKNFRLDDVYDPNVAVRLASRYVADLFKLFPDNPYAVAASYNTGEDNVERWIFRARSGDVDLMLAEIAIPETKDYVGKVMNNYRAYLELYTEDLKPQK